MRLLDIASRTEVEAANATERHHEAPRPRRFRLAVIIVHYRTPELLRDCLASLRPQLDPARDRVVIVENDTAEESTLARAGLGEPGRGARGTAEGMSAPVEVATVDRLVSVLYPRQNLGFAGANNLGIAVLRADYYLLLNPDTVLRAGAVGRMLDFLQSHAGAAMVAPRLECPDGTPQLNVFGDPTPLGELIRGANVGVLTRLLKRWEVYGAIPAGVRAVDWAAGACLLIRASVFATVGALDPGYFMYFEEVDFCRRARRAGQVCYYLPEARVVHLVGQASGVTGAAATERRVPGYWFASRHRYFRAHFGYAGVAAADLLWLLGHAVMWLRRVVTGVSHSRIAPRECADFLRHEWRWLRSPLPEAPAGARALQYCWTGPRDKPPSLWQLWREDLAAHGGDWMRPGFRAVAVHRFGNWRMGVRSKVLRAPLSVLYRFLFVYVRNHYGIELPYTAQLGRRVVIEHQSGIVIHGSAVIGDECILRQGVTVGNRRLERPFDAPVLGKRVNVGAGAKILGAVAVGDEATIGANAVVLTSVPARAVAVGVPARVVAGPKGGSGAEP